MPLKQMLSGASDAARLRRIPPGQGALRAGKDKACRVADDRDLPLQQLAVSRADAHQPCPRLHFSIFPPLVSTLQAISLDNSHVLVELTGPVLNLAHLPRGPLLGPELLIVAH